jgi:citrate lyase beta subunit
MQIPPHLLARVDAILTGVDSDLSRHYPGVRSGRQPVHTVYVSAADAAADLPQRWGGRALEIAADNQQALAALDSLGSLDRTREILRDNPIQDLRLDFEDGYRRPDSSDAVVADARRAGQVLAQLPPEVFARGVRIEGFTTADAKQAIRTLEAVLCGAGGVPSGFVFTVPKLRAAEQVDAAVLVCEALEAAHGLPEGTLRFELQIETPQAVVAADGTATVARAIHRAYGRCSGLHYGTYDYSAACGIAPQFQAADHPVADHAKAVMQAAAAGTGVWVSDGADNMFPEGSPQRTAHALSEHHRLVTRALQRGFPQGWDMHPGQLVTRWMATVAFYRAVAADRDAVLDEPATARALDALVARGVECGVL